MEELNKLIQKIITEYGIESFDSFIFDDKLSTIIDKHQKQLPNIKCLKVSIHKSVKYSKNFISTISEEYLKEFDETILDLQKNNSSAYSDLINNQKYIYLPYQETIIDSFTLTHEIIHATTLNNESSDVRNLFTEAFAFLAEMLQRDYFKKLGIKNYMANDYRQVNALNQLNITTSFQRQLLNEKLQNGYISLSAFREMMKQYNDEEAIIIGNELIDDFEKGEIDLLFQERYIIGYPLACYMYENYKENFAELNNLLNEYGLLDFLDYLDLSYKDKKYLDLTDESYNKIEKSYIKKLKRM